MLFAHDLEVIMNGKALEFIKLCIRSRKIHWTYHVNMRLKGRFITREALLFSVDTYKIIEEYPDDKYLPSCLIYAEAIEIRGHNT